MSTGYSKMSIARVSSSVSVRGSIDTRSSMAGNRNSGGKREELVMAMKKVRDLMAGMSQRQKQKLMPRFKEMQEKLARMDRGRVLAKMKLGGNSYVRELIRKGQMVVVPVGNAHKKGQYFANVFNRFPDSEGKMGGWRHNKKYDGKAGQVEREIVIREFLEYGYTEGWVDVIANERFTNVRVVLKDAFPDMEFEDEEFVEMGCSKIFWRYIGHLAGVTRGINACRTTRVAPPCVTEMPSIGKPVLKRSCAWDRSTALEKLAKPAVVKEEIPKIDRGETLEVLSGEKKGMRVDKSGEVVEEFEDLSFASVSRFSKGKARRDRERRYRMETGVDKGWSVVVPKFYGRDVESKECEEEGVDELEMTNAFRMLDEDYEEYESEYESEDEDDGDAYTPPTAKELAMEEMEEDDVFAEAMALMDMTLASSRKQQEWADAW